MRQRMRASSHGFKVRHDCITRYSMAIRGVRRGVCRRVVLVLMMGSGLWRGWLDSGWGSIRQGQISGNGEADAFSALVGDIRG